MGRRDGWRRLLLVGLAMGLVGSVLVGTGGPAQAAPADAGPSDRYELAGGCYQVLQGDDASPALRFQATDLGRYLLMGPDGRFATGQTWVDEPAPEADWRLDQDGGGAFRLVVPSTGVEWGDGRAVGFRPARGCAHFPEVEINVTGEPFVGPSPIADVQGYLDGHLHLMAYEFLGGKVHCGRIWHRFGVTQALVDCPDHHIADGAGAIIENLLSGGDLLGTHDTTGWPTFDDWPAPGSLTHEQTYYRWVERAWRGGLRILVNLLVENRVLCEIYPLKKNPCDEMASVRLQNRRIRELERYIDAQHGGPGRGWFRIVDDPFEARRVVNEGKLAVVLGIEISEPFGCRTLAGVPQCSAADIDRQLDELDEMGVRQLTVIHKFDNALGGVAFDGGIKGPIINIGQFLGSLSWWAMDTCDAEDTGVHDNDQSLPTDAHQYTELFGTILAAFAPGVLPVYPPAHHCNVKGLTALGAHTVRAMMDRQMVVDIDHMSVKARQQTLDILEARSYPGVISSHSWATPDAYPRVQALGGIMSPYAGGSSGFIDQWRDRKATADPRYLFGLGYGADANGLGAQGEPRSDAAENPVTYPFTGLGGVVIDKQVSGERAYDINRDGVAHYGLYPDWIEDLRVQAGDEIVDDLAKGAEAYLQMWERTIGIPGPGCPERSVIEGLPVGASAEEVLRAAGQPVERGARSYTYCVAGGGTATARFDGSAHLVRAATEGGPPVVDRATGPAGGGGRLPATGGRNGPVLAAGAALLLLALIVRRAGRRAQ